MANQTENPQPAERLVLRPQQGPQEKFLTTQADFAIYGGARGSGKSYALLFEPLRHIENPTFTTVIFRESYQQITNAGGIWDEARQLYPLFGAYPRLTELEWVFPSGASISFSYMEHDSDVENWKSAQVALIGIDQIEQISEYQFNGLMSCNRSVCGVKPYIRATCNPEPDTWLAKYIDWYIDQDTGYPIHERSGIIRWYIRESEELIWGETKEELLEKYPRNFPKSFTFISAKLFDNKILMEKDPGYLGNLMALPLVQRERYLSGNWKIRESSGMMFPRDKWQFIEPHQVPTQMANYCRFWDKAGTAGGKGARTAGVLLGTYEGRYYVMDAAFGRWGDLEREKIIKDTADMDTQAYPGAFISFGMEQEPGTGGKDSSLITVRNLAGYNVFREQPSGDKASRWKPFACQVQAGNVYIVKGSWKWAEYIQELDNLSGDKDQDKKKLKDLADASAGAFKKLALVSTATVRGPIIYNFNTDGGVVANDGADMLKELGLGERLRLQHQELLTEMAARIDSEFDQ